MAVGLLRQSSPDTRQADIHLHVDERATNYSLVHAGQWSDAQQEWDGMNVRLSMCVPLFGFLAVCENRAAMTMTMLGSE